VSYHEHVPGLLLATASADYALVGLTLVGLGLFGLVWGPIAARLLNPDPPKDEANYETRYADQLAERSFKTMWFRRVSLIPVAVGGYFFLRSAIYLIS
jgi:hypothetical protein